MHRFILAVGGGPTRSRDLSRDEAREAMALVADARCAPEQVGAFLMALRMKGESAEELAGFAEALRERCQRAASPAGTLDVDCHGDGHAGRPTLLPAAACAVAALGVPVLLRADLDALTAKHGLAAILAGLGLDRTRSLDAPRAAAALGHLGIAVLDLPAYAPALKRLVDLRLLFGRRTVAQTLTKLLDPLSAAARLLGVFHAPYLCSTAAAAALVGGAPALCVQAIGGLPEAAPGKLVRAASSILPTGSPYTLDFRGLAPLPVVVDDSPNAAVQQNNAALAGAEPLVGRAAATAALLLHAARGEALPAAADRARQVLATGAARAVADRLREV